jgi:Fe2+ transport system protein FeoA
MGSLRGKADGSGIVGDGRSRYRSGFTGMDKSLQRRLKALGFRPGADVEILRDVWPFPLHIRVGMTEVMVRRKDWTEFCTQCSFSRTSPQT